MYVQGTHSGFSDAQKQTYFRRIRDTPPALLSKFLDHVDLTNFDARDPPAFARNAYEGNYNPGLLRTTSAVTDRNNNMVTDFLFKLGQEQQQQRENRKTALPGRAHQELDLLTTKEKNFWYYI